MKQWIPYIILMLLSACASKKNIIAVANQPDDNIAITTDADPNYNLYYQADQARLLGNTQIAKELFLKYLSKQPNNAAANYYYGYMLAQEGNAKNALPYLQKASKIEPENLVFKEALAISHINNKNISTGAKMLIELSDKSRAQSPDYLYKALYYLEQNKKYAEALEVAMLFEKKHGLSEEIINRKIRMHDRLGNTDAMILELDKLIAYDPTETKYYIAKMQLCQELNKKATVDSIKNYLEQKFINEPEVLRLLIKENKEDINSARYIKLIETMLQNNNIDAATKIELLWPAVKEARKNVSLQEKILQQFKGIYDTAPTNSTVAMAYANVLSDFNKTAESIAVFNNLIKLDNKNVDAWLYLINMHVNQQKYDSAISTFQRAKLIFPRNPDLYLYAGQAYSQQLNYNKALEIYNEGLLIATESIAKESFISSLADVHNSLKNYKLSDSLFEEAIKLNPVNSSTLNNYAYYLSVRNERLIEAANMSLLSLQLSPDNKTFLDTYAWILYKQGSILQAEEAMQKCINAEGETDAVLYDHYGDILFKLNKVTEALDNWKRAQKLNPKLPNIDNKITFKKLYE